MPDNLLKLPVFGGRARPNDEDEDERLETAEGRLLESPETVPVPWTRATHPPLIADVEDKPAKVEEPPKVKEPDRAKAAAEQAFKDVQALNAALSKLESEADRPSGASQAFSMLFGGLPLVASGGWSKERKYRKAKDDLTKRYWEMRRTDLATETAKAKEARTKRALTEGGSDALSSVVNRIPLLGPWLQGNWANGIIPGDRAAYNNKINPLIADLTSGNATPQSRATIRALKGRLDSVEKKRDEARERWEEHGASNRSPDDGHYVGPFSSNAPFAWNGVDYNPIEGTIDAEMAEYAMRGARKAHMLTAGKKTEQVAMKGGAAKRLLVNIAKLQGVPTAQAESDAAEAMAFLPTALAHTGDVGMDRLVKLERGLATYYAKTGQQFLPDPEAFNALNQLRAELGAKLRLVDSVPPGDSDRVEKILLEAQELVERIQKVTMKVTVDDSARLDEANRLLTKHEGNRDGLVSFHRKAALADVDAFKENVSEKYLTANGGDDGFLEKVTLDKNNHVVKFDTDDDDHIEAEAWTRIIPSKRRDALTVASKKVVTKRDALGHPIEFWESKGAAVEMPKPAGVRVSGGTDNDFNHFKRVIGPAVIYRVTEMDVDGRLYRNSPTRRNMLRWVSQAGAPAAADVTAARDLLTPEPNDFDKYSAVKPDGYVKLTTKDEVLNFLADIDAKKFMADQAAAVLFRASLKGMKLRGKDAQAEFKAAVGRGGTDKDKIVDEVAKFLKDLWRSTPYEK